MKESKNTKKVKVTCKVSLVAAKNAKLRWRLVRAHRTYANGTARARYGRAFIRLPNLRTLHRSRYVLRIAGRRSGTVIVVR